MTRQRLRQSFWHAFQGILQSAIRERNLKIHMGAAIVALFMAWWLHLGTVEMILLILTIAGVVAFELVNTAIESVVDLLCPQYHPLAKRAKDAAAGAVLVMAIASLIVGYFLFIR